MGTVPCSPDRGRNGLFLCSTFQFCTDLVGSVCVEKQTDSISSGGSGGTFLAAAAAAGRMPEQHAILRSKKRGH